MKILKGVLTYTLLIIGIGLVLGMIIIGSMFLFPKFEVFGWKVMFKSNEQILGTKSNELVAGNYKIEIDAKLHDVNIYQFTDNTKYILVNKVDDMFGFYSDKKYDNKPKITNPIANNNTISIKLDNIKGAVLPRKSRINIYLPHGITYDLNIKTTSGDVYINGAGKAASLGVGKVDELKIKSLDITTTSGNFGWANIRSTILLNTGNEWASRIVETVDRTTEEGKTGNFMKMLPLSDLRAKTKTGKLNFTLNNSDADVVYLVPEIAGNANFIEVFAGKYTNESDLNAWLNRLVNDTSEGFYFEADRGNFKFDSIINSKINIVGNDVLVTAEKLLTWNNFYFNAPSGFFNIKSLESFEHKTLSTIITNNIDIKLETVGGELSISTTYGNIEIGKITASASLSSTHGDIKIGDAQASVSAISEYGDITVSKYSGRGYFKNKHGKITATFDKELYESKVAAGTIKATDYKNTCEMYNEDGSITAKDLVFEVKLTTTAGGTIDATFYKMFDNKSADNRIKHEINLNGGKASVKVPNTQAFRFKGEGSINGSVGSNAMSNFEGAEVTILTLDEGEKESEIALLTVKTTSGSITFSAPKLD